MLGTGLGTESPFAATVAVGHDESDAMKELFAEKISS